MSYLSDSINLLASNVFGSGTNVSVSLRKSPIELNQDAGPTAHLNDDPFAFSSISYPSDVTQDMQNGHYMLFYINVQNKTKYAYTNADTGKAVRQKFLKEVPTVGGPPGSTKLVPEEIIGEQTSSGMFDTIRKGGKGSVLSSDRVDLRKSRKAMTGFSSVLPTTSRITDSIAIYLPPDIKDSTSASYNNAAEMGVIGLAAAGAVDFTRAMARNDFAAASGALLGTASGIAKEALKRMGSEFVGGVSGVDPEAITGFANKAFGQATNPYMEVIFEKVGMRTFSYNFTFSPRNEAETADVQKIIKIFRFHMLPELQGTNERFLTLPSTFDIHYMYQMKAEVAEENSFYSKIATCVLSGVDVDYAPDGVKSFASGAPTQIKMGLNFMETEMLTKQHVDAGF
jgi:hypothetical protein